MKRLLLGGGVLAVLAAVVGISQSRVASGWADALPGRDGIWVEAGEKNPWTSLKLDADPDRFQFAVVSDRTGGHRPGVFSKAVYQINLMQPTFVVSVGDLIEGYTQKEEVAKEQWEEFDGFARRFQMPFFYVPGNHDLATKPEVGVWEQRYGKRYYHFVYRNTLFLCLCSEAPPGAIGAIDPEQREYARKALEANKGVRWTFVFLHRPVWTAKDLEANGWADVEKALAGRPYTVFCGHVHRYQKYVRNGMNYYQLATTGGGSRMRGVEYGEFDHFMWVTVKKEAPALAVVPLEGLLPEDLKLPETDEPGVKRKLLPTHPVEVTVKLDGQPVPKATVSFYRFNKDTEKYNHVADGLTDAAGRTKLSTYAKFDGVPAGEYAVTVVRSGRGYYDGEVPEASKLPAKYAAADKTTLRYVVKEGANELVLELTSK